MREEFYRENAKPGCRLCGGSGVFVAVTPRNKLEKVREMCSCVIKRVRAAEKKMNKFADMLHKQEN